MKEISVAEVWEICRNRIYDNQSYIRDLASLLQRGNIKRIYYAGCGNDAELVLNLLNLGYQVECSDKSNEMLEQFQTKAKSRIKARQIDWRQLAQFYCNEFDLNLVKGNSIIYVDSWGKGEINPEASKKHIFESLSNFHYLLKPDGLLCVDLYNEYEKPHIEDLGQIILNENPENWQWEIEHDWDKRIRIWRIIRTNPGWKKENKYGTEVGWVIKTIEKIEHTYYSYLIKHSEFIEILEKVGFKEINKVIIKGSPYTTYLARK